MTSTPSTRVPAQRGPVEPPTQQLPRVEVPRQTAQPHRVGTGVGADWPVRWTTPPIGAGATARVWPVVGPAPVGSGWSAEWGPHPAGLSTPLVVRSGVPRAAVVVGVGGLVALLLVLITLFAIGVRTFTLEGSLTLTDAYGSSCVTSAGYSDIRPGADVTVRDAQGTIVANGALSSGRSTSAGCRFPFSIDDVPGGSAFYQVEVTHRGLVTFTAEELASGGALLTLGR